MSKTWISMAIAMAITGCAGTDAGDDGTATATQQVGATCATLYANQNLGTPSQNLTTGPLIGEIEVGTGTLSGTTMDNNAESATVGATCELNLWDGADRTGTQLTLDGGTTGTLGTFNNLASSWSCTCWVCSGGDVFCPGQGCVRPTECM